MTAPHSTFHVEHCPAYVSDGVELYLGDCLEIAPGLAQVDSVITDPPYGMNLNTDNSRFSGGSPESVRRRGNRLVGTGGGKPILNDHEPFNPIPWLDYPIVVLFGCNHFAQRLPVGTTLIWLKRNDGALDTFLSDAELAWMKGGHGVYAMRFMANDGGGVHRLHPCQKPIPLMNWVMEQAKVSTGATVLDPYMGSGTTGIACIRTGRKFIGIEKDPVHFQTAVDRIKREQAQLLLL